MTTNYFIIRAAQEGVKLLSINDLITYKFSLQRVLDTEIILHSDVLHVQITDSHLIIACGNHEWGKYGGKHKSSI